MPQTNRPEWPTHPDGRPKKIGEMTPEQRREQFKAAAQQALVNVKRALTH
nr:hypothetical protein [Cupriavidus gilardii]WDE72654.1 hypothetical protein [Cupriavidus gilardii]